MISVKDFKSIIAHAGINNTTVKARYSHPSSPMQLTYSDEGLQAEFILMTIGESRAGSSTPTPHVSRTSSKRPASRQPLDAAPSSKRLASSEMPPPSAGAASSAIREASKAKATRPSPPPPQPSIQPDALFFPEPDDDQRWDPVNYDEEEDEMLLWDAGGDSVSAVIYFTQHADKAPRVIPKPILDSGCRVQSHRINGSLRLLGHQLNKEQMISCHQLSD